MLALAVLGQELALGFALAVVPVLGQKSASPVLPRRWAAVGSWLRAGLRAGSGQGEISACPGREQKGPQAASGHPRGVRS